MPSVAPTDEATAPATASAGHLPIGLLARRSGVAASALRFYEEKGLIQGRRSTGGQRLYAKDVLRRVAFIRIAQSVGLGLEEIKAALATLPAQRTPTPADWAQLSAAWTPLLQTRIDTLTALRDQLQSCIGCGCLSLSACKLYNPGDGASRLGNGPRYLLGNRAADVVGPGQ
jgi:MerR family redox-sensitive transcriptional activator SoxR